jgi:ribonuclease T2
VIDRMRDLMPNPRLTIHEYRQHGTCSGLDPDSYYALARRLTEHVKVPPRFEATADDQFLSPTGIIDEFVAANPELKPEMLAVTCGGPGNRLKDVRVCFDRDSAPRNCGPNESRQRLCRASRLHIPPVRPAAPAR